MKHNFAKCINTCNFYISFSRRHDRQTYGRTYGQTHRRGGIASVRATPNGNGIIQSYGTTKNSSFILWCRWRLCLIAIWKDHMEQLRIWWRGGGGCSEAMASGTYKLHSIFKGFLASFSVSLEKHELWLCTTTPLNTIWFFAASWCAFFWSSLNS